MKSYNETGRRRDPHEKRVSSVFAAVQGTGEPVPPDCPVAGPAGQRAVSALHHRRAGGPEESRPAVQRVVHLQADGALGRGVAEKTGSGDAGA